MDIPQPAFEALLLRIESLKASKSVDLSTEEDLSIAVMNLISLEEHFYFTGVKTDKPEYFDLLQEVRAIRKDLLARLIDRHEGETWCITKHLLATTMRLIEVGTKSRDEKYFDMAYKLYSLFWALRLKLIDLPDLPKIPDTPDSPMSLQDITAKLVDCCKE